MSTVVASVVPGRLEGFRLRSAEHLDVPTEKLHRRLGEEVSDAP